MSNCKELIGLTSSSWKQQRKWNETRKHQWLESLVIEDMVVNLCKYWCVNSPLVMAPTKREGSKPRLFIFSIVVDARLEELLIITILLPVIANFSTIRQNKHKLYHIGNNYGLNYKQLTQIQIEEMKTLPRASRINWLASHGFPTKTSKVQIPPPPTIEQK